MSNQSTNARSERIRSLLAKTNATATFEVWISAINDIINALLGVSLDDLPDIETYDFYEDGMTVAELLEDQLLQEMQLDGFGDFSSTLKSFYAQHKFERK